MSNLELRLRSWTIDWNGATMDDREPPRDGVICRDLREAADEIGRLRAAISRIDAINDSPACFNKDINDVCDTILRPHLTQQITKQEG